MQTSHNLLHLKRLKKMKRIFEVAMELKVTTRRVLEYLDNLGYDISRNQMQPVTEEMHLAILQEFGSNQVEEVVEKIPEANSILDAIRQRIVAMEAKDEPEPELQTRIIETPKAVPKPEIINLAPQEPEPVIQVLDPPKAKPKAAKRQTVAKPKKQTVSVDKKVPEVKEVEKIVKEELNREIKPMNDESNFSVDESFKILINALKNQIKGITKKGMQAIENGDFEKARIPLERAASIPKLMDKLNELKVEWAILSGQTKVVKAKPSTTSREARSERAKKPRLPRGTLTSNSAYTIPILKSLVEIGGSTQKADVIKTVGKIMEKSFNKFDLQPPAAHPKTPRWQIKFDKIRVSLIDKGLLVKETDSGIWEISKKGRDMLKAQKTK